MKKEKLTELLNFLNDKGEDINRLSDNIKKLSDDDINVVLKSINPVCMIMLLSNPAFKNFDTTLKNQLIKKFTKSFRKIYAEYVIDVISNPNVIEKNMVLDMATLINTSFGKAQAKYALEAAIDKNVLARPDALKIVSTISAASSSIGAQFAKIVAKDIKVLSTGKTLELVQAISKVSKYLQAELVLITALNENVLLQDNAGDIVNIVASSIGPFQAKITSDVACNQKMLASGRVIDVIRILRSFPEEKIKYLVLSHNDNMALYNVFDVDVIIYYLNKLLKAQDKEELEQLHNSMIEEMKLEIMNNYNNSLYENDNTINNDKELIL